MNVLSLLVYVALGAGLAWAGIALLRRTRRRTLRCITPYVPASARTPVPAPRP